jgi:hypothetical protein
MVSIIGENYLITKAKEAQEKDPFKAKSLILTAKTLYPLDFGVQVSDEISTGNFFNFMYVFSMRPMNWRNVPKITLRLPIYLHT